MEVDDQETGNSRQLSIERLVFVRPLTAGEELEPCCISIRPPDPKKQRERWQVVSEPPEGPPIYYEFDGCFWQGEDNSLLSHHIRHVVKQNSCVSRSTTILFYGPRNTGRSWLLLGQEGEDGKKDSASEGLLAVTMAQTFSHLKSPQRTFISVFEFTDDGEYYDLITGSFTSVNDVARQRVGSFRGGMSCIQQALEDRHNNCHLHIVLSVFDTSSRDVFDVSFVLLATHSDPVDESVRKLVSALWNIEHNNETSLKESMLGLGEATSGSLIMLACCAPLSSDFDTTRSVLQLCSRGAAHIPPVLLSGSASSRGSGVGSKSPSDEVPSFALVADPDDLLGSFASMETGELEEAAEIELRNKKQELALLHKIMFAFTRVLASHARPEVKNDPLLSELAAFVPGLIRDRTERMQMAENMLEKLESLKKSLDSVDAMQVDEGLEALQAAEEQEGEMEEDTEVVGGMEADAAAKEEAKEEKTPTSPDKGRRKKKKTKAVNPKAKGRISATIHNPKPDVLCCEDVKVSLKLYQRMLGKEGYRVATASDGAEAVEMYKKYSGSLQYVLMDIKMPVFDGTVATKRIRAYERDHGLEPRIILGLTGYVDAEDLQSYASYGMNGCIAKGQLIAAAFQTAIQRLAEEPNAFVNLSETELHKSNTSSPQQSLDPEPTEAEHVAQKIATLLKQQKMESTKEKEKPSQPAASSSSSPSKASKNDKTKSADKDKQPSLPNKQSLSLSDKINQFKDHEQTKNVAVMSLPNLLDQHDANEDEEEDDPFQNDGFGSLFRKSFQILQPLSSLGFGPSDTEEAQNNRKYDAYIHERGADGDQSDSEESSGNIGMSVRDSTRQHVFRRMLMAKKRMGEKVAGDSNDIDIVSSEGSDALSEQSNHQLNAEIRRMRQNVGWLSNTAPKNESNELRKEIQQRAPFHVRIKNKKQFEPIDVDALPNAPCSKRKLALQLINNIQTQGLTPYFDKPADALPTLPKVKKETQSKDKKKKPKKPNYSKVSGPAAAKASILVVEDLLVNRKIIKRTVEMALKKQVIMVGDGEAAVEAYRNLNGGLELILMDVGLPGMDGMEATRQIRKFEAEKNLNRTKILALTSATWEENILAYQEAGMDGCIRKGTAIAESVRVALASLERNPGNFVSLLI